jgi:hypothetical protein
MCVRVDYEHKDTMPMVTRLESERIEIRYQILED